MLRHRPKIKLAPTILLGVALTIGLPCLAAAHPMGNFAICHYTRLEAAKDSLKIHYLLDLAEIPTVDEKHTLDANQDGTISTAEKSTYLSAKVPEILSKLQLTIGGRQAAVKTVKSCLQLAPGAGGLETLKISVDLLVPLQPKPGGVLVQFKDENYAARTGWKEIIAVSGGGTTLLDSSASSTDRSHQLTSYPTEIAPPQDTEASFKVVTGPSTAIAGSVSSPPAAQAPTAQKSDSTPRDAFTQAITSRELTPGIIIVGLLVAFFFGAVHALSPGHGKAMVAAYLVGSRGTAKHAALLGMVVTITHTLGVFALGFATLVASKYIVPEKLYPVLSAISGAAVCGVGLWSLRQRILGLSDGHSHDNHHHEHEEGHSHSHGLDGHVHHHHDHPHDHEHPHEHTHDHGHSHGNGHHHHHIPVGPVTPRALIALGISGGIVPCPSALVVLLAAIALHRIAYGMALITAFSLGLAAVLVAIGLMVVWARELLDKLPSSGKLFRRVPVASAAMITLIGVVLIVRAFSVGP
jgi:nickel/cobalt exporter